jgi:3-oxoacyl-[acyl-carrier protein] reductase
MRLKDRVAIITGGGSGIGKATALCYAKEGAKVVVAARRIEMLEKTKEEIEAIGGEALAVKTDITLSQDVNNMAGEAIDRFGRIDILVNNSAIFPLKPWMEIEIEEWDQVMAVNLRGCFLCAKAVYPHMQKQGKGKIINLSSGNFWHGRPSFFLHYASSKAGIIGFTRSLAREIGDSGGNVNVNAVTPGLVQTDAVMGKRDSSEDEDQKAKFQITGLQCFKRMETPDDILGTMVFLASDDSDFITGQVINVDGGWILH